MQQHVLVNALCGHNLKFLTLNVVVGKVTTRLQRIKNGLIYFTAILVIIR